MGNYLCHAALVALIAIASAQGKWIMTEASAQTATQAQGRSLSCRTGGIDRDR